MKTEKDHNSLIEKTGQSKLGDIPVSRFMNTDCVKLKPDYTLKSTIEAFRIRHVSGAPMLDYQDKVIGVISEYDLLIQAATKDLSETVAFQSKIVAVYPETTLKEVLVIFYKQKLKWMPVINQENYLQGVISRIDVLNFIATHSPNAR